MLSFATLGVYKEIIRHVVSSKFAGILTKTPCRSPQQQQVQSLAPPVETKSGGKERLLTPRSGRGGLLPVPSCLMDQSSGSSTRQIHFPSEDEQAKRTPLAKECLHTQFYHSLILLSLARQKYWCKRTQAGVPTLWPICVTLSEGRVQGVRNQQAPKTADKKFEPPWEPTGRPT